MTKNKKKKSKKSLAYLRDVFCHRPLVPVRPCCPVLHLRSLRIQIGEVLTELDVGQGCGDLRGLDARLDLRLPHLQIIQIKMDEKFANFQMRRYLKRENLAYLSNFSSTVAQNFHILKQNNNKKLETEYVRTVKQEIKVNSGPLHCV